MTRSYLHDSRPTPQLAPPAARFTQVRLLHSTPALDTLSVVDHGISRILHMTNAWVNAESALREHFRAQAASIVRLQHPNLNRIIECGELGERTYTLSPAIASVPLHVVLRGQPSDYVMPEESVVHFLTTMLQALDAIHSLRSNTGLSVGLLHGDPTPDNFLIDREGNLTLHYPFPWSQRCRQHQRFRYVDLEYIAVVPPEVLSHQTIDARSDVYAVIASVMYTLVYARERSPRLEPITTRFQRLSQLYPSLDHFFTRALQDAPEKRFSSTADALKALREPSDPAKASKHFSDLAHSVAAKLLIEPYEELLQVRIEPSNTQSPQNAHNAHNAHNADTAEWTAATAETFAQRKTDTLNLNLADLPEIRDFRGESRAEREDLFTALRDAEQSAGKARAEAPGRTRTAPSPSPHTDSAHNEAPWTGDVFPTPDPRISALSDALRALPEDGRTATIRRAARARIATNYEHALTTLSAMESNLSPLHRQAHQLETLFALVEIGRSSAALTIAQRLADDRLSDRDLALVRYFSAIAALQSGLKAQGQTYLLAIAPELRHRFPDWDALNKLAEPTVSP